jgi:hypothetical protein
MERESWMSTIVTAASYSSLAICSYSPVLSGDSSRSRPCFERGGDLPFHRNQFNEDIWGVSFLKMTPLSSEGLCTIWSVGSLLHQFVFLPICCCCSPQKNTRVQVPPAKPPETLAVPTVPPFFSQTQIGCKTNRVAIHSPSGIRSRLHGPC